jgi:hypothetical protein
MNNKPLLSLSPHQFALSKPLSDDIEFIDALLGTVLSQQGRGGRSYCSRSLRRIR